MNDVGFLYYRDKDTGEYKILGKANILTVYGIRNVEATTIRDRPSKIIEIDTTAREIGGERMNLNCPFCGGQTKVTETRGNTKVVLRRRKCLSCGRPSYTEETLILDYEEGAKRLQRIKREIYPKYPENSQK